MNIVILGAGALGSILAAHLIEAGETVSVIARGARAAQLRQHGLRVSGLRDIRVPCHVITDPYALQETDALIVTVKTYDTAEALAAVQHVRLGSVCSVQNGMLKNEQLAQTFGAHKVLGATCLLGGEVLADGETHFTLNENGSIR